MTRRRRAVALAWLLATLRTCSSTPAFADPCADLREMAGLPREAPAPPAPEPTPCTAGSAVKTGQPAPCDGVLWPAAWTVDALRCVRVDLPSCAAVLEYERSVCQVDRSACEDRLAAVRQLAQERAELLERATLAPAPPPSTWWRSPWVPAGAGVVVGAALAAAVAWAVH